MKKKWKLLIGLAIAVVIISVVSIYLLFRSKNTKETTIQASNENILNEVNANNINITSNEINVVNNEVNVQNNEIANNTNQINNVQNTNEVNQTKNKQVVNEVNTNKVNSNNNSNVIVIDPGHQTKGDSSKEPIGPGATQTKAKVTTGATGVTTKQTESSLNLKVAKKLQAALEAKGYKVIMTRTVQDVNISNSERAKIANEANAAAFIRIHANSADSSSAKGVLTMCQTANNPYNGNLASKSYSLSKAIVDKIATKTGAQNRGVTKTDDMSGINWCTVPTTIIEMGFLSNPEEDKNLASDSYQQKIVDGIVEGLEQYLKK